jgi:hypothetical protein
VNGYVDEDAIIRLEFYFFRILEHFLDGNQRLYQKLARDPKLFINLLRFVYKSERNDEPDIANAHQYAEIAFTVLRQWRRVPGTQADGSIDQAAFSTWVTQALSLTVEDGRGPIAQSVIGTMLAHVPSDAEGQWPCAAVRDVLDHPDHDAMRRGLKCGLLNKRGVTCRSSDAGGTLERNLAARYRVWADGLFATHWRLAEVLTALANIYERDARSEDADAAWSCDS